MVISSRRGTDMDVVKALLTRRSVREYTDKKNSDETILKILDCGNNEPV